MVIRQDPKSSSYDKTTLAVTTIDYEHHEIHEGKHFKGGYGVSDDSLQTDDIVSILFTTSDTNIWAHWSLTATATGYAKIELYENPTITASGTSVTIWNRNRNSSNSPTVILSHSPTTSGSGTKMVTKMIGGTGFKTTIGDEHRGHSEFILKQNEQYMVVGTALADNVSIQIGGDWYEHRNTVE